MSMVFASSFLTDQILSWALPLAVFAVVCVWFFFALRSRRQR
jgi:hypothetical protein